MNTRDIEQLLEKYYEGMTTLEEEKLLKDFFSGGDIPEHLSYHAPVFLWSSEEDVPDFEIVLPEEDNDQKPVISLFSRMPAVSWISGIAATLLIVAGLIFILNRERKQNQMEMAYQQTKEALMIFSSNLNTGLEPAAKFSSFSEGVNQVQNFSTFYKYQTIIINPDRQNSPQNNYQ